MFDNILVVCHGNVCRSPVGEALLKKLLPHRNIQSAGLGALVGRNADTTAVELARQEGGLCFKLVQVILQVVNI